MARFLIPSALLFSVACNNVDPEAACEDYVEAALSCIDESFGEATGGDAAEAALDNACAGQSELTGDAAQASVDLFECYTEEFNSADCSSKTGYSDAATALATNCADAAL